MAKGESIAIFRAETQGWSNGTTVVRRGETLFPPDGGPYWQK